MFIQTKLVRYTPPAEPVRNFRGLVITRDNCLKLPYQSPTMVPKEKSEFSYLISETHIKVNGTKYTLLSVDSGEMLRLIHNNQAQTKCTNRLIGPIQDLILVPDTGDIFRQFLNLHGPKLQFSEVKSLFRYSFISMNFQNKRAMIPHGQVVASIY